MNILDYLATEFATFEEKPFNPLDSAVLSQFCMVRVEQIAPRLRNLDAFPKAKLALEKTPEPVNKPIHFSDALRAELYETMFTGLVPGKVKENMLALAASPRFREMIVHDSLSLFDDTLQTQFAAMTFTYKDQFAYVGFRGTDSSFTGWKEDFNMAYTFPIPSQQLAVRYLESVAPLTTKRLLVGGHSKGANLAVYAALRANAATQKRIAQVYSHDGPGFRPGLLSQAEWQNFEGRIHRTVPQDSTIGLLMETQVPARAVHSVERGIMQHSIFSWDVEGDDFCYLDSVSESALFTQAVLSEWLAEFPQENVAIMVKSLFGALESSGAQDVSAFLNGGAKTIALISEALKNADGVTRDVLLAAVKAFTDITARQIGAQVSNFLPKSLTQPSLPNKKAF